MRSARIHNLSNISSIFLIQKLIETSGSIYVYKSSDLAQVMNLILQIFQLFNQLLVQAQQLVISQYVSFLEILADFLVKVSIPSPKCNDLIIEQAARLVEYSYRQITEKAPVFLVLEQYVSLFFQSVLLLVIKWNIADRKQILASFVQQMRSEDSGIVCLILCKNGLFNELFKSNAQF